MTNLGIKIKIAIAKNKQQGVGVKSQTELAEKLKISRGHLSAIITGREKPSLALLERIASELNMTLSDLLKEE